MTTCCWRRATRRFSAAPRTLAALTTPSKSMSTRYEDAKTFLAAKGVDVFEEEDRKEGVFVGRQFYIRDPDDTVIEFTEWHGASGLDCCSN